jgi:transcriptional antiterminator NusG
MSEEIRTEELFPEEAVTEDVAAEAEVSADEVTEAGEATEEVAEGDEVVGAAEAVEPVDDNTQWFVVHTYSGYENKVKANIESLVENRKLHDQIKEVIVPLHKVLEEKNGARKEVDKKLFPGYVLIKMNMNDETWYVVRNTRGVTGFVGPGSKPVPLTEREIKSMGIDLDLFTIDVEIGDTVTVTDGPFEGSVGVVQEIHDHKRTVIVNLSIFGRETPVELEFNKMDKM